MIALVRRVTRAEVHVAGASIGAIGTALLMLVCAEPPDTEAIADELVAELLKLRVFACGEFGAAIQVSLVNGGPLTIPMTFR